MKILKNRTFLINFLKNYSLKTVVLSIVSLIINLGFVIFNTVSAFLHNSVWYGASAVYYLFLSLLKGSLFFADKKVKKAPSDKNTSFLKQLKNYRFCGISLFIIACTMTGVVTLMVTNRKPIRYSEVIAIMFATYTCYKITMSIIHVVKATSYNNLFIQSIRNIGLAETALSLVSLQMALISTFSTNERDFIILNAIVGFLACAFTICVGLFMIISASRKIKKLTS